MTLTTSDTSNRNGTWHYLLWLHPIEMVLDPIGDLAVLLHCYIMHMWVVLGGGVSFLIKAGWT